MMHTLAEALDNVNNKRDKATRILALQSLIPRYREPIKRILRMVYDPKINFDLSDVIPYESNGFDEPGILIGEIRRLYIFTKEGNPNLTREKRDKLFGDLLSTVAKSDALLLLALKRKKLLQQNITKEVALAAFPDLLA